MVPTTSAARLGAILELTRGFLYYVSMTGVTGGAGLDAADVSEHVAPIRARTDLPVAVGFGVRDAASAEAVARSADAVVVGSALIRTVEAHFGEADPGVLEKALHQQVADLRAGADRAVNAKEQDRQSP